MLPPVKVVLDTDVLVAAVLSPGGAARAVLLRLANGTLAGCISTALLLEYEAVLKRPHLLKQAGLEPIDVDAIVDQLAASMEHVESYYLWRPQLRDPNDEMVLETAVNGGADAIVTFNRADFALAPSRFGVEVLRPADLMRRI